MAATNGLLLPIPELTESADGPDAISDLANAVEDYVLDRILPIGVTHYMPHFWGSGTSFPGTGLGIRPGDTYQHTGLGSLMRYNGTAWRQLERAEVASQAARDAIFTNYASLLHVGFKVWQIDKSREFEFVGTVSTAKWHFSGGIVPTVAVRKAGASSMAVTQWHQWTFDTLMDASDTSMWNIAAPSALVAPIDGIYLVTTALAIQEGHGVANLFAGISFNGALRRGPGHYHSGVNTPGEFGFTSRGALAAGQVAWAHSYNTTTSPLNTGAGENSPRFEMTWIGNY